MVVSKSRQPPVKHILGIEGGGTNTVAALLTTAGQPVQRATLAVPSNLGALRLPQDLHSLVSELRDQFGFDPASTRVVSGFAGAGTSQIIGAAESVFQSSGFQDKSIVISDGELALEALGGEGILFVAGTGSICIGRRGSVTIRNGGNGYLLGDEASGFYVARRALNAILNAVYGSARPTAMTPLVLRHFGIQRAEDIKSLVYGDAVPPKREIAAIAPIVFSCAAEGDLIAASIVTEAVDEIARSVGATRSALGLDDAACMLGLRGGLFRGEHAERLLVRPLEERIAQRGAPVSVRMLESDRDPHIIIIPAVQSIVAREDQGLVLSLGETVPVRDTERPHPHSANLDAMNGEQIVTLFDLGNSEVLNAVMAPEFMERLDAIAVRIRAGGAPSLVFGGAGTSGRIAHYIDKHFSGRLDVRHWIAGGSRAITEAVEGAEDNVFKAMTDIRELLREKRNPFVIGISCGLSAPCVAGALLEARNQGAGMAVFGMTPIETARNESVAGGGLNFAHLLGDLRDNESQRYVELAVRAGPELLTGSSRLKGGTATWLTLYSLCEALCTEELPSSVLTREVERLRACRVDPEVGQAVELAGMVIRAGGDLIYVAQGALADAAALDASEIAPTFGVPKERVRVVRLDSVESSLDLSHIRGTSRDLVVYLGDRDPEGKIASQLGAQSVRFSPEDFITAKMHVLNPLSTGAFARAGYVFENRMLNVRPSNSKLLDRAVGIVAAVAKVELEQARRSLIAAMIGSNDPTPEDFAQSPEVLCRSASTRTLVVPHAIAHAVGISLDDAESGLNNGTPLRVVIDRVRGANGGATPRVDSRPS
jgi:N-acetylmuramic acid 6-phosphate (MurNAc-6-P) etherase/N-acetylglucosamine kinase-like BadF-type ATPase